MDPNGADDDQPLQFIGFGTRQTMIVRRAGDYKVSENNNIFRKVFKIICKKVQLRGFDSDGNAADPVTISFKVTLGKELAAGLLLTRQSRMFNASIVAPPSSTTAGDGFQTVGETDVASNAVRMVCNIVWLVAAALFFAAH